MPRPVRDPTVGSLTTTRFLPAARGELDRLLVLKTACHGTSIIPGGPAGHLWAHIATRPRHSARVYAIVSPIENSEMI